MSKLQNSRIYLCGQVEKDKECAAWRAELTTDLLNIEPTLIIWDPMVKPRWMNALCSDPPTVYGIQTAIENHSRDPQNDKNINFLSNVLYTNNDIRRVCRKLANTCDILIARICDKFSWGTIDELEICIGRNIPIFIWYPQDIIGIYGLSELLMLDHTAYQYYIHRDKKSMLNIISDINSGICNLPYKNAQSLEKWSYITYHTAPD